MKHFTDPSLTTFLEHKISKATITEADTYTPDYPNCLPLLYFIPADAFPLDQFTVNWSVTDISGQRFGSLADLWRQGVSSSKNDQEKYANKLPADRGIQTQSKV